MDKWTNGQIINLKSRIGEEARIANGEWRMENGEWRRENGEGRMEKGEWGSGCPALRLGLL
jgi:hypothetical protein